MKKILSVALSLLLLLALCTPLCASAEEENTYPVTMTVPNGCTVGVAGENGAIPPLSLPESVDSYTECFAFALPAGLYTFDVKDTSGAGHSIHFRVYDDGIAQPAEYSMDGEGFFRGPYLMEPNLQGNINSQTAYRYADGVLTLRTSTNESVPGYVNAEAFADMECIKQVIFTGHFTSINESAFLGCTGLTSVRFDPDSTVGEIGAAAFADCKNLTEFVLPKKEPDTIDDTAFDGTPLEGQALGNATASVLSEGALWIVIAVAAVAIIAVIGLIIWKKRKKVA